MIRERFTAWRIRRLTAKAERLKTRAGELLAKAERLTFRVKQLTLWLDERRGLRVLRRLRRRR